MDNLETIQQCLNDFQNTKDKEIGPELNELLLHIAKTGKTEFQWHLLKPLVAFKLEKVLEEMFENCPSLDVASNSDPTSKPKNLYPDVKRLVDIINNFTGTPFTIQRLCELLNEPKRYYKTMEKLFHGLEKNIMVVSTIKPDGTLITRSSMLTNGSSSPVTRTTSIRPAAVNNQTPLNSTSQLGVNSLDSEVTDSLGNCDNTSLSNCDIKLQENIEINQDQSCEPETCNASFSDESHSKSQSSDLSASVDVGEDVIEKENSNPLDENFNDEKSMSDERL